MATAASNSHMNINMQAYSVLANVHKSDPTHELAATNARAGRASAGHEADRYYRTI